MRSLPSRERGLKSLTHISRCATCLSLPSRERGLKLGDAHGKAIEEMSLPSRERGLKSSAIREPLGARNVAPLAGAWIEINTTLVLKLSYVSLPSRERGLKSRLNGEDRGIYCRSPRGSVD